MTGEPAPTHVPSGAMTLAASLSVLRLGLDLLAEAADSLASDESTRLIALLTAATGETERIVGLVSDPMTGRSAA